MESGRPVDTLELPPPHTLKSTYVCCALLLAALFYRAIYSSVSCAICFVWRKVNLESEAKWSQAGVSTAAHLYILLAALCVVSRPDTGRRSLIHEYVSVFWCSQSPSYVLISNWKNQIVLAPALQQFAWRVLRSSGRNAAGITDSKASLISEDTFAHGNCCKPATRKTAHRTCTVNIAQAWESASLQEILKELNRRWVDKKFQSANFCPQNFKSASSTALASG